MLSRLFCLVLFIAASPAAESLPPGAVVRSLLVQPATVDLKRPTDYAQLLVTAQLADGNTADVTRLAKISPNAAFLNISPNGLLRATGDGTAILTVELGVQSVNVPISVAGFAQPFTVDYVHDVMPVLSKAGCNAGTCHGSKEGKAGFKLSLRGYDPIYDVRAFTDDAKGRRTNLASPDDSLMLLKATGAVPHEGQQVMTPQSDYYRVLRAWIAGGAKLNLQTPRVSKIELTPSKPVLQQIGSQQQMRVVATYADGLVKDVTAEAFIDSGNTEVLTADKTGLMTTVRRGEAAILARFEGNYASTVVTVMGDRSGFVWAAPPVQNEIDKFVLTKLERMKTSQSGLCTDEEFVRRIYLDLTGLPPLPEEMRAFLADGKDRQAKREALIDQLIGSEPWVEQWSNKWADLLQVNSKFLGAEGAKGFREWIRKEVADNTPYDEFVRKVLTASGSNRETPPASYFKILREPAELMENTTHLFLATRFNCNKCHDHPFERWTQDQYYQMTAYFAQVGLERDPESGDRNIGGSAVEGAKPLFEKVVDKTTGETKHDRTGAITPPQFPYAAKTAADPPTRRVDLANWITSADNQYFAKSFTNRIFGYLTGTGLIEPLDDIRAGNPASNPELLDWLTQQFIASKFDVRTLQRLVCTSRVYQLSMHTDQWNEDDTINYSHAKVRRLPAETLYDAIYRVTGSTSNIPGVAPGTRAAALQDSQTNPTDGFLVNLGRPVRESACECERSADLQMGPVMALISGPSVGEAISQAGNAISKLEAAIADDAGLVKAMFERILGRSPNDAETKSALETMNAQAAELTKLKSTLVAYQNEMAEGLAAKTKAREDGILVAKAALDKAQTELAPKIAAAEMQRKFVLEAADIALQLRATMMHSGQADWEKSMASQTGWTVLDPTKMASSVKKTVLKREADLSIFVAKADGKQAYTITTPISLASLSGVRIEALTDNRLPGKGPGLGGGGNFVLTEMQVAYLPNVDGKPGPAVPISFSDATATFSQGNYDVKEAIDGELKATDNGWAISPEISKPQTAFFTTKSPVEIKAGGWLQFTMVQEYSDGKHLLGKFRLSATGAAAPLNFGLPAVIAEALAVAPAQRNAAQAEAVRSQYQLQDAEYKSRAAALAAAQKPLPEEPRLAEAKTTLARAEAPLPVDRKLEQYESDVKLSEQQLGQHRLTGAQDLAWALINSPSFLFNR